MEVADLAELSEGVDAPGVAPLVASIRRALANFTAIGLGYISLGRPSSTLSGGEAQRVKMIRHLGSALSDATYVFDEPTAGLHAADIDRLNELLAALRDKGNTVLVVEHRAQTIEAADHVVELGPGAGTAGGEIVFEGTVEKLRVAGTRTGESLKLGLELNDAPRTPAGWLEVRGASENNLAGIDVDIPTGVLTAITGAKICGHLVDVGLGYVTLGQPLTTLSGGERQRLKLAASLKKPAPAYVLDEPTTGLHLTDTARLVDLFNKLVDAGATTSSTWARVPGPPVGAWWRRGRCASSQTPTSARGLRLGDTWPAQRTKKGRVRRRFVAV